MSRKEVTVSNVSKKHDNPIAELVQVACQFDSNITLESDNRKINAKSIMGIMAFNSSKGMTVNIVAEGNDEEWNRRTCHRNVPDSGRSVPSSPS